MFKGDRRQLLANAFLVIGIVLLLAIPGSIAVTELQGQALRARLQASSDGEGGRSLPASPGAATARRASPVLPEVTRLAVPTALPTVTPTPLPSAPAATPTPSPTPSPSPSPSPTVTPEPTPTRIPGSPPVRIVFSALSIDAPVTEMGWREVKLPGNKTASEWILPENAAGHAANSARIGDAGNVVISAHNNVFGRVFMAISQAWPENNKREREDGSFESDILNGRRIELYAADGRKAEYVVTAFRRLKEEGVPLEQRAANAAYMQQTSTSELTLITCWPPWSNTHRLIIRASSTGD